MSKQDSALLDAAYTHTVRPFWESFISLTCGTRNHNPATAANGSHELSSCHWYSARVAICKLVCLPQSLAINASVMSIPALIPDDVTYLLSSIHRAFATHSTLGP